MFGTLLDRGPRTEDRGPDAHVCRAGMDRLLQVTAHAGGELHGLRVVGATAGAPDWRLRALALPLYPRKPPVTAEAPVPPHMRAGLGACGFTA